MANTPSRLREARYQIVPYLHCTGSPTVDNDTEICGGYPTGIRDTCGVRHIIVPSITLIIVCPEILS